MPPKTPSITELARMHLLNPAQRDKIQDSIRSSELGLRGLSMFTAMDGEEQASVPLEALQRVPGTAPDPALLRESIRRDTDTLKKGTPPPYSGLQKNKIYADVKEAAERIRRGMPSNEQMERPTWSNIQLHTVWQERRQGGLTDQLGFINGMRVLDPAHETISVEMLRPSEPSYIDYKAFMEGYDFVQWTAEMDLEREQEELDDSVYAAFKNYRAAGIQTAKLIQRKLEISQATYEACQRRFADEIADLDLDGDEAEAPGTGRPGRKPAPLVDRLQRYLARKPKATFREMTKAMRASAEEIRAALAVLKQQPSTTETAA